MIINLADRRAESPLLLLSLKAISPLPLLVEVSLSSSGLERAAFGRSGLKKLSKQLLKWRDGK